MALGYTVRELLSRIDSKELAEWQAYDSIDPFGEMRADLRAGIIASASLAPHMKKGKKPPKPADFIPTFRPAGAEPAWAEPDTIKFKLMGHTVANGGTIKERKK